MNLRPRALVAEPSTWLAALICCGLCARGVVWLSCHRSVAPERGAPCRSPRTGSGGTAHARAHSRHVRRADVDPEQPGAESPRVRSSLRGQRSRRTRLRALSIPRVFFRLDADERGHGDVRPHRSAAALDRRGRPNGRLSRRGSARSAGNCGAAPAGRTRHRQAATVLGVRDVNRRRSVPSCRAAHI